MEKCNNVIMKTFKNCGLALTIAAALVMTTASCSSENELTETPIVEQPTQPTTDGVKITVSAGIADDATTRSEVATEDGKRVLKFTTGDRLYVYREISSQYTLAGMLDMVGSPSADGKSASFTGTIKVYDNDLNEIGYELGSDPLAGTTATLVHKNHNSNAIYITVGRGVVLDYTKMSGDDVETVMTSSLFVQGSYDGQKYTLGSYNPIFNCTFSGLYASTEYTLKIVHEDDYDNTFEDTPGKFTTDANGVGRLAFISEYSGNYKWKLVVKSSDGSTTIGEIKLGDYKTTISAKIYNVRRNYGRAAFGKFVDISTLSADFEAQDGDVLSGTLANNVKISIAAGAMVTLSGARINDNDAGTGRRWTNGNYAGLTCLGDATIILADGTTNTVRNFDTYYPGIQAAHNTGSDGEYTLTICGGSLGTGQLIASSDGGAGIGGGVNIACGNITIEGGTVTANGEGEGAGIGSSAYGSCGDITINGGTVTATGDPNYGNGGAGIGSGYMGSCGKIIIRGGSVTATGGTSGAGIGSSGSNQGYESICGKIEITGGIVSATGGTNGAGIGSGRSYGPKPSTCGDIMITLNSGSITATGGQYAAGIGTGYRGICGSISVYMGIVDAYRNNHNGGDYCDIGPGLDGTAGSVNVNHQVTTSNGMHYVSSNAGYRHY